MSRRFWSCLPLLLLALPACAQDSLQLQSGMERFAADGRYWRDNTLSFTKQLQSSSWEAFVHSAERNDRTGEQLGGRYTRKFASGAALTGRVALAPATAYFLPQLDLSTEYAQPLGHGLVLDSAAAYRHYAGDQKVFVPNMTLEVYRGAWRFFGRASDSLLSAPGLNGNSPAWTGAAGASYYTARTATTAMLTWGRERRDGDVTVTDPVRAAAIWSDIHLNKHWHALPSLSFTEEGTLGRRVGAALGVRYDF